MEKNIKAIIFDLDGTLLNSENFQMNGWVIPLKKYGINLTKEQYLKYAGKQGEIIEGELYKDFGLNMEKGELLAEKESIMKDIWYTKRMELMPFAKNAIEYFYNKSVYKLGACYGGDIDEARAKLRLNDLEKYFDAFAGASEVKIGKPHPDVYLLCAKKLGIDPENCLAFEDTMYGLRSAKDAGMFCYAIPNEYSKSQNFSRADKILKSLKDVLDSKEF